MLSALELWVPLLTRLTLQEIPVEFCLPSWNWCETLQTCSNAATHHHPSSRVIIAGGGLHLHCVGLEQHLSADAAFELLIMQPTGTNVAQLRHFLALEHIQVCMTASLLNNVPGMAGDTEQHVKIFDVRLESCGGWVRTQVNLL